MSNSGTWGLSAGHRREYLLLDYTESIVKIADSCGLPSNILEVDQPFTTFEKNFESNFE